MTLDVDRLRELMAKATPLPWLYRPDKYDDWGWVRGGPKHAFGRVIVAAAREGRVLDEDELSEHRRNKTDPCAPNGELIVAAVNALPSLLTRIAELEECARVCAAKFREYAQLHSAKLNDGLPDAEFNAIMRKSQRNRQMAEMCEALLSGNRCYG